MLRALVLAAALAFAPAALAEPAQAPRPQAARPAPPDIAAQRAAISKLDWMVGRWEGTGWIDMPGGRETFRQTEAIEKRLGDTLIVIEGRGYAGAPETMMFNAFAVISYNDQARKYGFRSHAQGYSTDAAAEVLDGGGLRWTMSPPGIVIRYTSAHPQPGKWHEVGERSMDGGATWIKFFEMNLTKTP